MNGEEQRMANNRKAIKEAQKKELFYVGYYVVIIAEYIVRLITWNPHGMIENVNAFTECYYECSLIVEQYRMQKFSFWSSTRKPFYWRRYMTFE